jgi:hypothetical protein
MLTQAILIARGLGLMLNNRASIGQHLGDRKMSLKAWLAKKGKKAAIYGLGGASLAAKKSNKLAKEAYKKKPEAFLSAGITAPVGGAAGYAIGNDEDDKKKKTKKKKKRPYIKD